MQGLVVGNGRFVGVQNRGGSSCVQGARSLHARLHTRPWVHRRHGYVGIGRRTVLQLREVRVNCEVNLLMRDFSDGPASQASPARFDVY